MGNCYSPQQERGVYRTNDGGKTWERVLFVDENTGAIDVVMDPANPKMLFAGMWQITIHPWSSENGGPGSGVYTSRDGGTTWTHLTGHGLPNSPLGRIDLAVARSNAKRVYALIETADQETCGVRMTAERTGRSRARIRRSNSRRDTSISSGVSPDNADDVYFLAQSVYHSVDAGATTRVLPELFPDHHNIWFDPTNANRIIIANDRYVNISTTHGRSWLHTNLPIAQVNRVAVDRRVPYNVFGSRQDGPAYAGPSNSLVASTGAGAVGQLANGTGVIPPDLWVWTIGAESGWAIPDRGDDNILWVSSGSNVQHIDMRTSTMLGTGPWAALEPAAAGGGGGGGGRVSVADRPYRRNWTIPVAMSPHNPLVVYAGSQFVHMTADGGKTWSIISPDLTTNDKSKQATALGLGPDGQDVPCTLIAIEESAIEPGVIWTGSNDGVVSVTRDGGRHWSNVTASIPNLPAWGWVNSVTPSRHAFGTAYITVDRHRGPDNNTYVYKTADYGRTWTAIGSGIPKSVFAYARVVREDPRRKGMLYLGTENGLYVTVDDGATWLPLQNNLPHTPIAWLTVQEDFDDLVVATWGRGFWIMDDIAPLQDLTPAVLGERAHLFDPRPAYEFTLREPTTSESFAAEFDPPSTSGHNPPYGASINYYLRTPVAGDVTLSISNDKGVVVRTLTGSGAAGINRVWWNLRASGTADFTPVVTPGGRGGGGGGGRGAANPLVAPGTYSIQLSVEGTNATAKLMVRRDPKASEN